jgi:putative transposase
VLLDLAELLRLATKSRSVLVAENLFLRKQLALFQERNIKPHCAQDSARWLMACLSRLFDWRGALVVVSRIR